MKTMISHLPRELIEEIFARAPLKATKALIRLTCKNWNSTLSKSQMSFAQMHIEKAARGEVQSTMITLMMNQNLYLMSVNVDHPSMELKGKLSCRGEQVKISQVLVCEGLLLCILEEDIRLVVWNPYSGKTTWIKPSLPRGVRFQYAFGYEDKKSCRSFKLLSWSTDKQYSWYEIYDFDSGIWKILDVTPNRFISSYELGVSLKGNTYWCVAEGQGLTDRIISFDFTRERFGPLLPLPFRVRNYGQVVQLSGVRDQDKLSVLSHAYHQSESLYPYELEMWFTTKIEVEKVSWSKVFKLEAIHHPIDVQFMSSFCFIDEEKKVAMGFDGRDRNKLIIIGEAGYIRELELEVAVMEDIRKSGWPQLCSYVPSLEKINGYKKKRFREN